MKKLNPNFARVILCSAMTLIPVSAAFALEVTVTQSGTLSHLLSSDEKANTVELTVVTDNGAGLNSSDFAVLTAMPKLKTLDLSKDNNTSIIPDNAFAGDTHIETIFFPANLSSIGAGAFNSSALAGTLSFPASFKDVTVFESSFIGCKSIEAFSFPENTAFSAADGVALTFDGSSLLKYPSGKTDPAYRIPDGVTSLASSAFADNDNLNSLTISSSVISFDAAPEKVFANATGLKEIEVESGNKAFASVDGLLVNALARELMFFPPAYDRRYLTVDGSVVESVPMAFFSRATSLKRVVFTEGVKRIGYRAFRQAAADISIPIEYIQLPTTIETIDGEAFNSLGKTIKQFVCLATVPPTLTGTSTFRESNASTIVFAVPAEAHSAYLASQLVNDNYPAGGGGSFTAGQIVTFNSISVEGGTPSQAYSAKGFSIEITADANGEKVFSNWETSTPGVTFTNASEATTFFKMPASDVEIKANFAYPVAYTVTGATISTSGSAVPGTVVGLRTDLNKTDDATGEILTFKEWRLVDGDGVVIANPKAVVTSFTMIDGDVEIEAVYAPIYVIDIVGGDCLLEAFEGDEVEITAHTGKGQFKMWTSETEGVVFADANSATTTFVMPASDVSIEAVFDSAGLFELEASSTAISIAGNSILVSGTGDIPVEIYNVSGVLVTKEMCHDEVSVDISSLCAGMYIVRAGDISRKFIKR